MALSARPYSNLSAIQLCEEGERLLDANDIKSLEVLAEEIGYRTKSRKKLDPLAERIGHRLDHDDHQINPSASVLLKVHEPSEVPRSSGDSSQSQSNAASLATTQSSPQPSPSDHNNYLEKHPLPVQNEISIHKIRACSAELKGVPEPPVTKNERAPVDELSGSELSNLPWAQRFYHALNQWILDRKRTPPTYIPFQNGRKVDGLSSGDSSFAYTVIIPTGAEELFGGAKVVLRVGNKKSDGRIVGIIPGSITQAALAIEDDLGEKIGDGKLSIDNTAMDAFIRDLLAKECDLVRNKNDDTHPTKKGLSLDFASRVLDNSFSRLDAVGFPLHLEGLNAAQASFVEKSFKYDISILWGPPGTGKTQSLTAVIRSLCAIGEKTLVCSHTNMAVDQVLLKCCMDGGADFVADHKMIRYGKIAHQDLLRDYFHQVTVEGISEHLGRELKAETETLLSSKSSLIQQSQALLAKANLFTQIDKTETDIRRAKSEFSQTQSLAKSLRDEVLEIESSRSELQQKYNQRSSGRGGLGSILGRSPHMLKSEIDILSNSLNIKSAELDSYRAKLIRINENAEHLLAKQDRLAAELAGIDRSKIDSEVSTIKQEVSKIDSRCKQLEESLQALRHTILENALVVGATLAKTCGSLSELGFFDNVIIDEASMASLPMLYIAASVAKKRVIISGDFSQLSPICQTENQLIKDIIGRSVFSTSGIEESVRAGMSPAENLSFLDTQYRMNREICELISSYMYQGRLKTGTRPLPVSILHPSLDAIGELVLIDSSTLMSFSSSTANKSKINLMHAYIARKFLLEVSDSNSLSLGYCTPFAGQAQLFSSLLTDQDKNRITSIGTVHKFQGDERDLLVYDTVAAQAESPFLGPWLNASSPQEEGAKNLNVAISRAKKSLVIIADLRVLDANLPKYAFLRDILSQVQSRGRVIDGRDLVALSEFRHFETEHRIENISVAKSALSEGMVDEASFFPLLYKSFEEAKKAIIIFSGFYTPARVNEMLVLLKEPMARGVKVKFVLPTNRTNGTYGRDNPERAAALVASMRAEGIVVEQRKSLHQKAVLIDEDLTWIGSLNPLSFAGSTLESMLLIRQPGISLEFANALSLPGSPKRSSMAELTKSETPVCPKCGAFTVFAKSKYGIYYPCEKQACDGKVGQLPR
jgi:phosphatidylserine/phosphatidylglycerophosphate/cardiolipin synthase-like enzyme